MAQDLANVNQISQSTFVDQLAEGTEDYLRCCTPITRAGATAPEPVIGLQHRR